MNRLKRLPAKWVWLLGALLGVLYGWASPPREFVSVALVELPSLKDTSAEERRREVDRVVALATSPGQLAVIVQNLRLYGWMSKEDAIAKMRRDIRIRTSTGILTGEVPMEIAFRYRTRHEAQLVVSRIIQGLRPLNIDVIDAPTLAGPPALEMFGWLGRLLPGLSLGTFAGGIIALALYVRRLQRRVAELSGKLRPGLSAA